MHVRAVVRWCCRENLLTKDPLDDVDVPGTAEKLPKAVWPEDVERMIQVLRRDYDDKLQRGECRKGEMTWMATM